jgi:hypothetical protein
MASLSWSCFLHRQGVAARATLAPLAALVAVTRDKPCAAKLVGNEFSNKSLDLWGFFLLLMPALRGAGFFAKS